MTTYSWNKLIRGESSLSPTPRSGHTLSSCKVGVFCFGGVDGRKHEQGQIVPNSDLYLLKVRDGMIIYYCLCIHDLKASLSGVSQPVGTTRE